MNETNPTPEEELAPLDPFEQQWVDQLAQREPDLVQSEDAFVQGVMRQHAHATKGPAVIARIGAAVLPYAVAAAVLLVGFVGWVALKDKFTDTPTIVDEQNEPTQPEDGSAVAHIDRSKIDLGKLISDAKATATNPATTFTQTVNEAPEALSVDRLFDLLDESVPDLQELLAPLEQNNEQSRV